MAGSSSSAASCSLGADSVVSFVGSATSSASESSASEAAALSSLSDSTGGGVGSLRAFLEDFFFVGGSTEAARFVLRCFVGFVELVEDIVEGCGGGKEVRGWVGEVRGGFGGEQKNSRQGGR